MVFSPKQVKLAGWQIKWENDKEGAAGRLMPGEGGLMPVKARDAVRAHF